MWNKCFDMFYQCKTSCKSFCHLKCIFHPKIFTFCVLNYDIYSIKICVMIYTYKEKHEQAFRKIKSKLRANSYVTQVQKHHKK